MLFNFSNNFKLICDQKTHLIQFQEINETQCFMPNSYVYIFTYMTYLMRTMTYDVSSSMCIDNMFID